MPPPSERRFALVLTAVFGVVIAVLFTHHELWRDELQAWLLARDSHGLADLFNNLPYKSHGPLFYSPLYPFPLPTRAPPCHRLRHLSEPPAPPVADRAGSGPARPPPHLRPHARHRLCHPHHLAPRRFPFVAPSLRRSIAFPPRRHVRVLRSADEAPP